jgi:hypothetical protein
VALQFLEVIVDLICVTTPSEYLVTLARRNADVYIARCAPRAILLAGSAAEGLADYYSDIDLIVYYDTTLPSEAQLEAVRTQIAAEGLGERPPRAGEGGLQRRLSIRAAAICIEGGDTEPEEVLSNV